MRRFAACFPILLALTGVLAVPSARAQTPSGVVLRLATQTPWNDPAHTKLDLRVRAVNGTDQTLSNLSLTVTIFTRVGSRSEYELSLRSDTGNFFLGSTTPFIGSIDPGHERTFHLPSTDLTDLVQFGDNAIYPMKVELRSNDQTVATLRSPVIYLAKDPPQVPLDLAWTFVLSAPIVYQPDGSFRTPWLQRQLAHGGELRAEAEALSKLATTRGGARFDVAVSPQLVDQLMLMRDGYALRVGGQIRQVAAGRGGARNAVVTLADLRTIAASRSVEVSALPYSNPNIPALIGAGLAGDLPQQLARGQRDVASAIGRAPVAGMLHPPGSHLDQRSLYELQGNGVHTLLVDSGTVDQPTTPLGFAEPPVAALSVGTTAPVDAIVPNDGVESLLQSTLPRQDPYLAAQQVLGELASIWLERPSVSRGVAVTVSEHTGLPGYFFGPFVHAIQAAPWLHPITASAMVRMQPARHHLAGLAGLTGPTFSPTYLGDLQAARQAITTYRSIASEKTLPAALDQMVLIAESGQFATQENLGEQFLHAVTDRLDAEFKGVSPDTSALETLTSRSGTIIVPIHNLTGHPVKVRVALDGGVRLAVSNNSQVVPVPVGGTTLRFGVQARTTGRFPVQVTISTPDGHTTLSQGRLVVRSTAYNRIALVLTIGAALFLLALWARRALPWTKR